MPLRHVIGVGSQVGARLVERVVKLQVKVMRLQIELRERESRVNDY
jgi:hypothetical protein